MKEIINYITPRIALNLSKLERHAEIPQKSIYKHRAGWANMTKENEAKLKKCLIEFYGFKPSNK